MEDRFVWSRGSWTPKFVGQREFLFFFSFFFFFHRIALEGVQLEVNKIYQDSE